MSPRTAIRHQFTETQRDTRGRLVRFAATASGVLIIDQLTKTTARLLLPLDQESSPHDPVGSQSLGFLRSANAGSALGFGQHQQRWVILALLGSLLTLFFALHRPSSLAMIARWPADWRRALEPCGPSAGRRRNRLPACRRPHPQPRRRRAACGHRNRHHAGLAHSRSLHYHLGRR